MPGAELARASGTERAELVRTAAVFARLSPEQKVSLVGALDPVSWLVVLGWAAVGTATAELAPGLIERLRGDRAT
ncbi:hypothetical protein [Blastococcus sp. CT_GayMR16]|uniref:hypothetical protein n=1 Tax=Blastococcus sp. CT_GayMR16 TaxID=2559607 RepID=UPI0010746DB6|nr:hypothetical protein [Blastococcus sp. CT_GayMR16]TFV86964.1 hypothetical protein E4P38_15070 [Blastococcus sp. CT_GayMR16]